MRRGLAGAVLALLACLAPAVRAEHAGDPELQHSLDRIRTEPQSAGGFAALAAWLFRQGDVGRARAAAGEAARLEPDDAGLQRLLGYLAAAAGDDATAEAALQRAAALDPSARAALADFHLARAWAGYQEALRRDGADPLLLQRLREIGAAAEITPELKALVRGGLPDTVAPPREKVPPIHLAEEGATAVVVEKKTQTVRLYGRGENGLALLKTYPCTTGQAAGPKQERGDLKTPDGVYFVHDLLPGEKLPNQYGALALPLDYPNAWDRQGGRNGHGIWFHGSDRLGSPFTPRDTKGCVIMRNDDLLELTAWIRPRATPILIAEEIPERPLLDWQTEIGRLQRRAGVSEPTTIVVAPEYALLTSQRGDVAAYRFVPTAPSAPVFDDFAVLPARSEWEEKLSRIRPQDIATLVGVAIEEGGRIVVETSAPVRARVFRPELGARVYIDLAGVRSSPVPERREGSGIVRQVRISAAATEPPLTRLAIELSEDALPRLESEGSRLTISLEALPPPAPPAPARAGDDRSAALTAPAPRTAAASADRLARNR